MFQIEQIETGVRQEQNNGRRSERPAERSWKTPEVEAMHTAGEYCLVIRMNVGVRWASEPKVEYVLSHDIP
jgi:outer membrane phospholipase A